MLYACIVNIPFPIAVRWLHDMIEGVDITKTARRLGGHSGIHSHNVGRN